MWRKYLWKQLNPLQLVQSHGGRKGVWGIQTSKQNAIKQMNVKINPMCLQPCIPHLLPRPHEVAQKPLRKLFGSPYIICLYQAAQVHWYLNFCMNKAEVFLFQIIREKIMHCEQHTNDGSSTVQPKRIITNNAAASLAKCTDFNAKLKSFLGTMPKRA